MHVSIPNQTEERRRRRIWLGSAAAVVLLAAFALLVRSIDRSGAPGRDANAYSVRRLTRHGRVDRVAISPDGRYIAYQLDSDQGESLWLRELGSGTEHQILPNGAKAAEENPDYAYPGLRRKATLPRAIVPKAGRHTGSSGDRGRCS
jgi:hypothetical protein